MRHLDSEVVDVRKLKHRLVVIDVIDHHNDTGGVIAVVGLLVLSLLLIEK